MPKKLPKRRKPVPSEATDESEAGAEEAPAIRASDLQGLKFFRKIRPLLESLHDVGTRRDKAANRDLHMDQYGALVLMWMFNPILTSLRGLQQASTLKDVQKKVRSGAGFTRLAFGIGKRL